MSLEVDIQILGKGGRSEWKLTKSRLATLTSKFGPLKTKRVILPRIRAAARKIGKQDPSRRTWLVRFDPTFVYNLKTGRYIDSKRDVPKGFESNGRGGIRVRPGHRLAVKNGVGRIVSMADKGSRNEMRRSVDALRRQQVAKWPTPLGMTRREYIKLHKLPRPWKMRGKRDPHTVLSRLWWDQMSREQQKDFRTFFKEESMRSKFPLTAKR